MTERKRSAEHNDRIKRTKHSPSETHAQNKGASTIIPKPESSSEYEGAATRKPTGNPGTEVKTETSSSSGE